MLAAMFHLLLALAGLSALVPAHAQTVLVKPYVQPADDGTAGPTDQKQLVWFTDQVPGEFAVEYRTGTTAAMSRATPTRAALAIAEPPPSQFFFREPPTGHKLFKYTAALTNLALDSRVSYRVTLRGETIRTNSFATRKSPARPLRFTVAGDMADGQPDQRKIACEIAKAQPDLMLVVGDIVYPSGTISEYLHHFWNEYNNTENADPARGAPVMASVPWYAVLGNHDVWSHNLSYQPDGLAAFYFFHAPANGPKKLSPYLSQFRSLEFSMSARAWTNTITGFLPVTGPPAQVEAFKLAAGGTYPGLCFYSFENGPALFLCLDANSYTNPTDPLLHAWIRQRLTQTKARWKFVFFHHPGFHSSAMHYEDQRMRLLAPVFEAGGVDMVFSGHIHNYQRSRPLRFQPVAGDKWSERGLVDGKFTIDNDFDGAKKTTPAGIIYIVSGGGGADLYNYPLENYTLSRDFYKDNWAPFTAKTVSDRHSFTSVEVDADTLTLRQIDEDGAEIERVKVTKPGK
ncbi:hypothetical protein LBMAG56_34890 [Verrucomicrobiota bacterium]|nr:hypothetical protein LBMAG56_34890 [Verrucomicrobiota bacterium]